jgi:asparagine synthase (glutamine-hydrolysing)
MDSTALLSMVQRTHRESIVAVTVALGADGALAGEEVKARKFAQSAGIRHAVLDVGEDWVLGSLGNVFAAMDQPSIDGANTWAVSRAMKEAGITVALSGLGGDEVFGGYDHIKHLVQASLLYNSLRGLGPVSVAAGRLASLLSGNGSIAHKAAALLRHASTPGGVYAVRRALFLPEDSWSLVAPSIRSEWRAGGLEGMLAWPPLHGVRWSEETLLLEMSNYMAFTLLRDTDAMSMAHALEVRVPLLDWQLVNYVYSLPLGVRFVRGRQKPLLAEAVPETREAATGRKQGFTLPFKRWIAGPLREDVAHRLSTLSYTNEWVSVSSAMDLFRRFLAGDLRLWSRVWALYVLDRWAEGLMTSSPNPGGKVE